MTWYPRRSWTVAELMSLGALAGLLLLIVCVLPAVRADAEAARTPVTDPTPPPAQGDAKPIDLLFPVPAVSSAAMADSFHDRRGDRVHHAVDILAPRHSEVVAVADGAVARMMTSVAGGLAVYQWGAGQHLVYYYAHLQGYAPNLVEGQTIRRGQVLGYVGTSGNAPPLTPHLHFAIARVDKPNQWWGGTPIDPYKLLR